MNFTPMTYKGRKTHKQRTIVEIVNTVIAAMLMLSPWLFRFSDAADAAWSAALIGLLLGAVTLTRDAEAQDWQSSVTLVLGVYSLLAPWTLGFANVPNAAGMHIMAGLVVVTMTAVDLWVHYLDEPPRTA